MESNSIDTPDARTAAADVLRAALDDSGAPWEQPAGDPYTFVVSLPGTRKLSTTCSLRVGEHTLSVNAFVVRRPDENHEAFYRWLLERNTRIYGLAYAIDRLGDVYLAGRLPGRRRIRRAPRTRAPRNTGNPAKDAGQRPRLVSALRGRLVEVP